MANIIVNNVDYTVLNQPEWFKTALEKGQTIAKGNIRVISNVVKETKVKKMVANASGVLQADGLDCSWDATEQMTAESKLMAVKPYKLQFEQCLQELDSLWSEQVSRGGDMPDGVEDAMMSIIQTKLSLDIEKKIWGNAVGDDTIVTKALVDADVIKVDGVDLTVANVLDELKKVYAAIPEKVLAEGDYDYERAKPVIFVTAQTQRLVKQALGEIASSSQVVYQPFTIGGNGVISYMGIELQTAGLPTGMMVAASIDNIVFLTDILADTTSISGERGTGSEKQKYFIQGYMKAGSDYVMSDELVIYRKL